MSQPTQGSIVAGPSNVDINDDIDEDREATAATMARLRDLCDRTGEDFDGNLTELQAKNRIAALEALYDLD